MKELPNELLDAFRGDLIRGSLRPPPPVPASEFQTLTRDQFLKHFVNKTDDFIVCFGQTWGGPLYDASLVKICFVPSISLGIGCDSKELYCVDINL